MDFKSIIFIFIKIKELDRRKTIKIIYNMDWTNIIL